MPDPLPTHDEAFDAAAYAADPVNKPAAERVTRSTALGDGLTQVDYLDPPATAG